MLTAWFFSFSIAAPTPLKVRFLILAKLIFVLTKAAYLLLVDALVQSPSVKIGGGDNWQWFGGKSSKSPPLSKISLLLPAAGSDISFGFGQSRLGVELVPYVHA